MVMMLFPFSEDSRALHQFGDPTLRTSAFTVTGLARDSHPHSPR